MSIPTKEQWAEFEKQADSLYSSQTITCDGFELTVRKELVSKNQLGIMVYVNGCIKGEWLGREKPDCQEQRFMRPTERYVFSAKVRQQALKILGKRLYAKERYEQKLKLFSPFWTSAASLRRHLVKTCKSITILDTNTLDDISKQAQELKAEMEDFNK